MSFLLERGGANNVALEVQRWQYFLARQGIKEVGVIDGQFGLKSETATKIFQNTHDAEQTGKLDRMTLAAAVTLGYVDRPSDFYDDKKAANFPPRPTQLQSPTNAARNRGLGCFRFVQLANRVDPDGIHMRGSCDGSIADWEQSQIVDITIPQLSFARGFSGVGRCHRLVAPHLQKLFERWDELSLLHLILVYDGSFNPRYKRGRSPGPGAQPERRSDQVDAISNHAFGSAFDVNAADNPFTHEPARCPSRGSVRELVGPANDLGFYWGGHFTSPIDGMHFEFADFARI